MDLLPRALMRLACVACLILTAVSADAADRVTVTGEVAGGAGRLEFVWPRPVEYDARVVFGRLVVRFSAPGEFDLSAYQGAMPQYLGDAKVVADGRVIAFPLRVPVSLRRTQDGSRITIELYDEQGLTALSTAAGPEGEPAAGDVQAAGRSGQPPAGVPQALVAEAPAAGETPEADTAADTGAAEPVEAPPLETSAGPGEAERLALRVGEHPGFSRLVFDWPSHVDYRIEQRGRRVTIDFEAAADLDLSNFRRHPLANVTEITSESGAQGLSVTLVLPAEQLVRHFLDGSHLVVDVVHDASAAKLSPSVPATELVPRREAPAAPPAEPAPVAAPLPAVTEAPSLPPVEETSTGEPANEEPPAAGSEPPDSGLLTLGSEPEERPGAGGGEPEPSGPSPADLGEGQLPAGMGELSLAAFRDADEAAAAITPGGPVGARKAIVLRFEWPSDPGRAAVFKRGRHLWIVFDQPVTDESTGRIARNLPALAPVERLTAEDGASATILRLSLPWAFAAALHREAQAWVIDLQPGAEEPQTALSLEYLSGTPDARIRFTVAGAKGVLSVLDPDLGDRLEIVPVPVAGLGLKKQRQFLQFRALATYQGLAIIPLSDGLSVEPEEAGVIVRDAAGLLVSPGADRDRALRNSVDFETGQRRVDQKVGTEPQGPSPAQIRLARVEQGLETGTLSVPDAIAALERLYSESRGDGFAFVALRPLAELYVESGDYGAALGALQQAVSDLPESPRAADAAARRDEIFTSLLLGPPSGRIAPLAAFGLYQDFRALTPAGAEGDRLMAHLADRLVEADRFDEAAQLLTELGQRQTGEAKVRTGARLALVRLLEGQPALALTALNASLPEAGFASLPEPLENDRRHLRSRALASLGRTAEAKALLAGDDSDEALRLSAEFYRAEKDWPAVAGILEKLAPPPGQGLALKDSDSELVLNLAVAYRLSGRHGDVSRITDHYGAAMADSAWRDEFAKLTGAADQADVAAIADELSGLAGNKALKARYESRLGSDGPRDVN